MSNNDIKKELPNTVGSIFRENITREKKKTVIQSLGLLLLFLLSNLSYPVSLALYGFGGESVNFAWRLYLINAFFAVSSFIGVIIGVIFGISSQKNVDKDMILDIPNIKSLNGTGEMIGSRLATLIDAAKGINEAITDVVKEVRINPALKQDLGENESILPNMNINAELNINPEEKKEE